MQHLRSLRAGQAIDMPVYDFKGACARLPLRRHVDPAPFIIVEGILLFVEHELRELWISSCSLIPMRISGCCVACAVTSSTAVVAFSRCASSTTRAYGRCTCSSSSLRAGRI